jgi:transposase InsO family protein
MDSEIKQRLTWVQMYLETGDVGLTCRRCGISRPTLRKWVKRYEELGIDGLTSQSRRPHHSPGQKVFAPQQQWILALRQERKLGVRRIQHELERLYDCHLSIATIADVLQRHGVVRLKPPKRRRSYTRYAKAVPGERVQMDTLKVAPGVYQYTAIDDCSRFVVADLYPRRTAANTLDFLDLVLDSFAVPVQCLQTDRGGEFLAFKVQLRLRELCIKLRPNRPAAPHLNGKVERVQQTMWREFYSSTDLSQANVADELGAWLLYYNYQRIHGSLGTTPIERFCERAQSAPLWEDVMDAYDPTQERYHEREYAQDQRLAQVHAKR